MIPEYLFKDLENQAKAEGDSLLAASLRDNRVQARKLKRRKFTDTTPGVCTRYTYDAQNKEQEGELKLTEDSPLSNDDVLNLAHSNAAKVREFFCECLGLDSFDGHAADLRSIAHYGENYLNAFFDGEKMTYGDGDGLTFLPFALSLDVAGHEMGHGVIQFTTAFAYRNQPGALNEAYADILGICCKHYHASTSISKSDWLIGNSIVGPKFPGVAIRSFKNEKAYSSDPQPKHMKDLYRGWGDNGGVHINSGIINHCFYLFCTKLEADRLALYSYREPLAVFFYALIILSKNFFKQYTDFKGAKKALLQSCQEILPAGLPHLQAALAEVGL